jgi:hypothetical protein
VCPAVPRPPLCLSVEMVLSTGSPRIFTLFTQTRRKEFRTKGNNKPDLRENRILQWHFAWKKMTRQSNGRPTRGLLPSEADQYKVSSRAQTYRHSIPICISSWLLFSLSDVAVLMAMCLSTLRCSGYYTYHLLEL